MLALLYLVFAVGRVFVTNSQETPPSALVVETALIVVPALVLLAGSYWLTRTDISSEFYPAVAGWTLAGWMVMVVLLLVYHLQPEGGLTRPYSGPPILTALGSVAGFFVGINNAIAKTRTHELQQRNRRLRQIRDELEETVSRAETSNERLEQFAYAASHDLQEPLRMVSSYLALIERRYGDELDAEGQEFFEFAVDGADRMRDMIASLLQYSRIETDGKQLEQIALESAVDTACDDLQAKLRETGATVTRDSLPTVEGDPDQIRQVFQNLLDNALTYRTGESPNVHISAERTDSEWTISVRDDGIGIKNENHARIFEVFERGQDRREYNGSGIGLAITQRIIERHDGEIWVDSEPGEGSEFSFTLPVSTD